MNHRNHLASVASFAAAGTARPEAPSMTPFLSGLLATGRKHMTTPQARMDYESGFMAIRDLESALGLLDSQLHARADTRRTVAEVDAIWSRIKREIEQQTKEKK